MVPNQTITLVPNQTIIPTRAFIEPAPALVVVRAPESAGTHRGFVTGSAGIVSGFCVAAEDPSNAVYRYVSDGEKAAVEKSGYVPNTDAAGNPRSVFYSPDQYTSASEAEQSLQIGNKNPAGSTPSPTWRITASPEGASWSYGGNVWGGNGVEMLTENPLRALSWEPLGP